MICPRRHRRFCGVAASKSSDELCGLNPSKRSRLALLRIDQRGRCNSSTSSDIECVGHKRLACEAPHRSNGTFWPRRLRPPAHPTCPQIRTVTWMIETFPHGIIKPRLGGLSQTLATTNKAVSTLRPPSGQPFVSGRRSITPPKPAILG